MALRDFRDLLADRHHRIEAGGRVLEDEADVAGRSRGGRTWPGQPSAPDVSASRGSRPAIASASVLLPEPLSPMTASRSPAPMSRSTPAQRFGVRLPSGSVRAGCRADQQRRHDRLLRVAVASTTPSPTR